MTTDWVPESRDVPAELEPDYNHPDYMPPATVSERMAGVPLMDRLDEVMRTKLHDMFGGI